MLSSRQTGFSLAAAVLLAGLAAGSGGCELIAAVDRSKIDAGGAGGEGGAGGTGGTGGSPECTTDADCPAATGECEIVMCEGGACMTMPLPDGTPIAMQTAGDCRAVQCDGAGMTKTVNEDADINDDGNPCTDDTCAGGMVSNEPFPAGTTCGADLQCDGNGACVGCTAPAQCPGTDDDCQQRTCDAGVCGVTFTAAGTATSMQVAGDCQENRCDGDGNVVSAALDTDLPVDMQDCTDDVCDAGVPSNPPAMSGLTCDDMGGTVCNGAGACVECVVASTCPGVDTECQQRACTAGVCGFTNTAAGTAVSMQTPGDCKVVQCNGAGATETVNQDGDLPVDGNPCTNDVCTMGAPSNPPAMAGMSCGASGVCDAAGQCVGCNTAADCPGMDTECQVRTCSNNTCGFANTAAGTPVMMQTAGDCKQNECNGAGAVVSASLDSDVPVDGNQCTSDVCTAGVPSNPPVASGGTCSQMGGSVCNGAGTCVQCIVPATCPGMDTDCQTRTCMMGMCGFSNAPSGTVTSMQTAGDCKANQCDGSGGVTQVNSNDPNVDGNQCTDDVCTMGTPSNPPSASGTSCNQGGAVCDGTGTCIQCLVDADCAGQTGGVCSMNVCQAPTCMDNIENGTETDVDCGGSCPNDCAIGQGCAVDADCLSGTCTAGVCSLLNGCNLSTADDFTVNPPPPITFANGNLTYAPKCIKVKVGTVLTFNGNFVAHPTIGGTVVGNVVTPAASGPFVPVTNMGTTKDFTMSTAGTFPYYCQPHATLGMTGVVYVVP